MPVQNLQFDTWYRQADFAFQEATLSPDRALGIPFGRLILDLRLGADRVRFQISTQRDPGRLRIYCDPGPFGGQVQRGGQVVEAFRYPFPANKRAEAEFRFTASGQWAAVTARGDFVGTTAVPPSEPDPEVPPEPVAPGLPWWEAYDAWAVNGIPIRLPAWPAGRALLYVEGLGTTKAVPVIDTPALGTSASPTREVVRAQDFGRAEFEGLWVRADE